MAPQLLQLKQRYRAMADTVKAEHARRFFKTGPGQYGEGDQFLGIRVPDTRSFLLATDALSEAELVELFQSHWHEERLLALLALVRRFSRAKRDEVAQARIVELYLSQTAFINNWDLVDSSASQILGTWLLNRNRAVLHRLATSTDLWEQRISIVATHALIRAKDFTETLLLCEKFLTHPHDLMHKACGWMLREVGKKDRSALLGFLDQHAKAMPRTMLRYAIEHLPPDQRHHYMQGGGATQPL
jgi:3-methyladenine DNA glycosylase AlkD